MEQCELDINADGHAKEDSSINQRRYKTRRFKNINSCIANYKKKIHNIDNTVIAAKYPYASRDITTLVNLVMLRFCFTATLNHINRRKVICSIDAWLKQN